MILEGLVSKLCSMALKTQKKKRKKNVLFDKSKTNYHSKTNLYQV